MRCIPIYHVFIAIGLLTCVVYSNPVPDPKGGGRAPRIPIPVVPPFPVPEYNPEDTKESKKAGGCSRKRWEGCLDYWNNGRRSLDVPVNYGHHHRKGDASPKAEVHNEKIDTNPEENNKNGKEYPKIRTVEEIREHFRKNRLLKELPHEKRFQRSFPRGLYPKEQEYVTPHYEKLGYDEQQALHAVNVTIEQNGKDPVAINIIIRNNSKMNVTIMARNSVIDKDSFRLGYFHVSPDDTKINFAPQREKPEWYHTPMGKYTKPGSKKYHKKYLVNDLVHLKSGETVQQTIPIPTGTKEEQEQWFKMIRHGKKIKLYVEGKWFGIGAWSGKHPHWSKNLDYGFKSNTIEVQLPLA